MIPPTNLIFDTLTEIDLDDIWIGFDQADDIIIDADVPVLNDLASATPDDDNAWPDQTIRPAQKDTDLAVQTGGSDSIGSFTALVATLISPVTPIITGHLSHHAPLGHDDDGHGPETASSTQPKYATLDELADYLTNGYWADVNYIPQSFNMTNSGIGAQNGVLTYNLSGFGNLSGDTTNYNDRNGLTEDRADMVRKAFAYFGKILDIDFVETTQVNDDVDIYFMDNQLNSEGGERAFAYMFPHSNTETLNYGYINVSEGWNGGSVGYDSYTWTTILHEIGHALGLGHQGDYNAIPGFTFEYDPNVYFWNDSFQLSTMSYFDQYENTQIDADFALPITMMAADLVALQNMYGATGHGTDNAYLGDTVWGFNTTINNGVFSKLAELAETHAFTIVDSGGIDTLDFSGFDANQKINLAVTSAHDTFASFSDIGGLSGNLALAEGTIIENAILGDGNDRADGNQADNYIVGNDGADRLTGDAGDDLIYGGEGDDRIVGNKDDDTLYGGAGKDSLYGSNHNDILYGEQDKDRLEGMQGDDLLYGGNSDDKIFGVNQNDTLYGGGGDDKVSGGNGDDTLRGGSGNDHLINISGDDKMWGGSGQDVFEFYQRAGDSVIVDYQEDYDQLYLRGEKTDYTLSTVSSGTYAGYVMISSDINTIILDGIDRDVVSRADFFYGDGY